MTGVELYDGIAPLSSDTLEYETIWSSYKDILRRVARDYVDTMNVIHYMHDKYYYERSQMALLPSYQRQDPRVLIRSSEIMHSIR